MKVLHLDDSREMRSAMRRQFQDEVGEFLTVATAAEAVDALAKSDWDLFISDWILGDGNTALEAIRLARDLHIPVLLLSGDPPDDVEVDASVMKGDIDEVTSAVMGMLRPQPSC